MDIALFIYTIFFFVAPIILVVWFAIGQVKSFNESCERQRHEAKKRHAIPFDE